jgi:hypothetical protein
MATVTVGLLPLMYQTCSQRSLQHALCCALAFRLSSNQLVRQRRSTGKKSCKPALEGGKRSRKLTPTQRWREGWPVRMKRPVLDIFCLLLGVFIFIFRGTFNRANPLFTHTSCGLRVWMLYRRRIMRHLTLSPAIRSADMRHAIRSADIVPRLAWL